MESKNKNILIASLLAVVLVMAVGYAAFVQQLTISGTAEITSTWNVHFDTSKTSGDGVVAPTTGAGGTQAPTGSIGYEDNGQKANITATLNQPGDKIVFTLTIKNDGNINAEMADPVVTLNGDGTDTNPDALIVQEGNIIFTVTPAAPTTIDGGAEATMTVTAEFDSNAQSVGDTTSSSITVTTVATQA